MSELTWEEIEILRNEKIASGEVPFAKVLVGNKKADDVAKQAIRDKDDYVKKKYVGFEVGLDAYLHHHDTGCSPMEALEYASDLHGMPEGFAQETKHMYYYYAAETVKAADTHPQQKTMMGNGTMDKTRLRNPSSAHNQLTVLGKQRKLSDLVEGLKEENTQHKQLLGQHETDIEGLKKLTGMEELSAKEKAVILKSKGYTQKEISGIVGKSLPTIKRWWKLI